MVILNVYSISLHQFFFAFLKYFFLGALSSRMVDQGLLLLHHHWDWEVDWTETED